MKVLRMSSTTRLAGGVGGARLARGLAAVVPDDQLTIVVNVGDDDRIYGAHVSADLDTVVYTLAGLEGPQGWGVAGDTFQVIEALQTFGIDTSFRLGDRDLALCLYRTESLDRGVPLSAVTREICSSLGVDTIILPATDAPLRTRLTRGSTDRPGVPGVQREARRAARGGLRLGGIRSPALGGRAVRLPALRGRR